MMRPYGVYGVFNGSRLMYTGQSSLELRWVEYNHRNWNRLTDRYGKPYDGTKFRRELIKHGQRWVFVWLIQPYKTTDVDIEMKEGMLIRMLNPALNVDKDPVKSSIKHNRYTQEEVDNV